MRRREFIALFGSVAAWPLGVHAQQLGKRVYRVGFLTSGVLMGVTDERRKNLVSALGRGSKSYFRATLGRSPA